MNVSGFLLLINKFGASSADRFILPRSLEVQIVRDTIIIGFVLPLWELAFLLIYLQAMTIQFEFISFRAWRDWDSIVLRILS